MTEEGAVFMNHTLKTQFLTGFLCPLILKENRHQMRQEQTDWQQLLSLLIPAEKAWGTF
ncbi:hypothetical protein STRDD11_01755 [Streptococcus sp. DD11]|nr:hypothetical protein STRDD11_01755 [Streptococcus sp. DD11]